MREVTLLVEFSIESGRLEAFRTASQNMIEVVRHSEPGTLRYEWFLAEDGTRDWNVETFEDSDALMKHLDNTADLVPALTASASIVRLDVLGDVNEEARSALQEWATGFYGHIGGVRR